MSDRQKTTPVKSTITTGEKPRVRVQAGRSVSQYVHQRSIALPTYEAGTTIGRRGVLTSNGGPNTVLLGRLDSMRNESRQAIRTNGIASHISDHLVANVVGSGIRPICPFPDLQELFEDWTDEADSRGQTDFYGLQQMAFRSTVEGGDSFTRLRARNADDVDTVPLQLQVVEAEHVPSNKNIVAPNGNNIIGGIERDAIDRPAAYWMYRVHPTDRIGTVSGSDLIEVRVPGADICHLFLPRRPGQVRGEPWLARALTKIRDIDVYDDAEVTRKKVTTLYGGFYRKPIDDDGGQVPGITGDADADIAVQGLEPGTFVELPPGYDVEFSQPTDVGGNYEAFMRSQLGLIGSSVNMIYEQVSGDWRQMTDRSYRAAMLEFSRHVESWQWHTVVFQWCRPIWKRFVTSAILSGAWTPPDGAKQRDIYRCRWSLPARGYIHPVQEITAYVAAMNAGVLSREQAAQQLGSSVFEIDMQNAIDKASADARGLKYTAYVDAGVAPLAMGKTPAEVVVEDEVESAVEEQVGKWKGDQSD